VRHKATLLLKVRSIYLHPRFHESSEAWLAPSTITDLYGANECGCPGMDHFLASSMLEKGLESLKVSWKRSLRARCPSAVSCAHCGASYIMSFEHDDGKRCLVVTRQLEISDPSVIASHMSWSSWKARWHVFVCPQKPRLYELNIVEPSKLSPITFIRHQWSSCIRSIGSSRNSVRATI
jgi:hypothetical protein